MQEKEIKCIQIEKEEAKLFLFADDLILHIENPKGFTRKMVRTINEFSQDINATCRNNFLSLQTNNEIFEKYLENLFTITLKAIKYK